jgi:FLVCR family feline leukemia virus subgroup C receptor-related protein
MVPVAEWALKQDYEFFKQVKPLDSDIRGDVVLLFGVAAATIVYFSTFDSPLKRTMADSEDDDSESTIGLTLDDVSSNIITSEKMNARDLVS